MDYPRDFPDESRAKVEAARIRAGRRFDTEKAKVQSHSDVERLFWNYVLAPFLVFAKESCRLALWPTDKMGQHCLELLRRLTIDAYHQKGMSAGIPDPISNWNGSIRREAQQKIEKAPQWRKYENLRLRSIAAHSSRAQNSEEIESRGGGTLKEAATGPFTHSDDYRTVTMRGENFELTLSQACMVRILHRAHEARTPAVSIRQIMEKLEAETSRWQDTWKGRLEARKALITQGKRKGTLRLNL